MERKNKVVVGSEVVTICHHLKLPASDGKMKLTDCANTIFLGFKVE